MTRVAHNPIWRPTGKHLPGMGILVPHSFCVLQGRDISVQMDDYYITGTLMSNGHFKTTLHYYSNLAFK